MEFNELIYPKPKRLPVGLAVKGKEYMPKEDVDWLLKSRLLIEEKMDGRQAFFEAGDFVLWCEDLRRKHSIKYRVPGRYALFDVYDRKKMQFLSRSQKLEVWEDVKKGKLRVKGLFGTTPLIFPVPRIAAVKCASPDELARFIRHSAYAIDEKGNPAMMEGIVVKQDRIQFYIEFIAGKIVREEFEKGIAVNYFNLPKENNIIDPSLPVVLDYPSI